jgi:hypothetical protein
VAKVLAKESTFARDFCKPKSPVKREFWPTTQKLEFLQSGFCRMRSGGRMARSA